MINEQARNIFQLQTELIDMKVNMSVSNAIDRVVNQISDLKSELKSEMHEFREDVNQRLTAVETKLGMVNAKRKAWYDRFMDQFVKSSWAWSGLLFAYLILHLK